jgi:hypothetical protein
MLLIYLSSWFPNRSNKGNDVGTLVAFSTPGCDEVALFKIQLPYIDGEPVFPSLPSSGGNRHG